MSEKRRGPGPAFLLAQLGAHAAARFAERLTPLGLTPSEAGILWNLSHQPDMTQRALSELLGAFPSRLVLLIDSLEQMGLVVLRPGPNDRRSYALRLSPAGRSQLDALGRISREHRTTSARRAECRRTGTAPHPSRKGRPTAGPTTSRSPGICTTVGRIRDVRRRPFDKLWIAPAEWAVSLLRQ
jgi:DNA-binding MarR family transcriptional regulator